MLVLTLNGLYLLHVSAHTKWVISAASRRSHSMGYICRMSVLTLNGLYLLHVSADTQWVISVAYMGLIK